jgi:hypothetical protein
VGDAVLAGVFAPSALLGLFRLIRAWVDLQHGRTTVKVSMVGQAIDIVIDSRSDPSALVAEVLRATAGRGGPGVEAAPGQDGGARG